MFKCGKAGPHVSSYLFPGDHFQPQKSIFPKSHQNPRIYSYPYEFKVFENNLMLSFYLSLYRVDGGGLQCVHEGCTE